MRFFVSIEIMPKPGVAEPQGATLERALPSLGYAGFSEIRVGKRIEMVVEAPDEESASASVERACDGFLVQPVIETYRFSLRVLETAEE